MSTMYYQAIRRLVFTDCSCATDASKTYEDLFEKLDTNKDGKVDVAELRAGLTSMGITFRKGAAQVNTRSVGLSNGHVHCRSAK